MNPSRDGVWRRYNCASAIPRCIRVQISTPDGQIEVPTGTIVASRADKVLRSDVSRGGWSEERPQVSWHCPCFVPLQCRPVIWDLHSAVL
jgi:hypothetical protein